MSSWSRVLRKALPAVLPVVVPIVRDALASRGSTASSRRPTPSPAPSPAPTRAPASSHRRGAGPMVGDWEPTADGRPDPGEVVWAWVPFEEDASQGKDRPVLVVGLDGDEVLALQLTSQDHDRDAAQEARAGRLWMDVGSGGWDRSGRPSEVRLNRLLRLPAADVRREGAALDRTTYDAVVAAARPHLGL
ncbi:type II toxin-antitoxin system PemK/MazF family toxin [Nocardioides perillae]|uniref:PemK-like, MazF-like toxin of type II toxin-antitoxin system n=1 Tax=Nocardioides perillae TaxID=1119534 RepID=A0A7Y9UNV7_9ACTN|nr:type II toxin-antitoxin system PemK/MazF family toxin [Nocardioides perillae]NYG56891.1 hypothetical protein [Nocardioides perillae]